MANQPLSLDEILGLVKENASPTTGYPPPQQSGPLRWYDKEMRCLHNKEIDGRRIMCHSPTYAKLDGIPHCTIHALKVMNERLTK